MAVALVLALVVALVVSTGRGADSAELAAPPGVTVDGGVISGDPAAPVVVDLYLDYQCPGCRAFEAVAGPWLAEQVGAGAVAVAHHPIAILDRLSSGTRYSTRAANAALCLADAPEADVAAFTADLLAQQPPEGGSGLGDAELVAAAQRAGGGERVAGCITERTHAPYVEQATDAATAPVAEGGAGVRGTPTVVVDGREVAAELAAVQQAVAAAS